MKSLTPELSVDFVSDGISDSGFEDYIGFDAEIEILNSSNSYSHPKQSSKKKLIYEFFSLLYINKKILLPSLSLIIASNDFRSFS